MQIGTLGIVGVGLIGGSIGLAAKRRGLARRVVGVGRRPESLEQARQLGAIDEFHLQLPPAAAAADFMIFCTPVQLIAPQIREAAAHCRPDAILTDAGSTKAEILAALNGRLPEHVRYVGSHPLAGSEKHGPQHADAELFQGRLTIITPHARVEAAAVERVAEFWKTLGARIKLMTPEAHDQALALTSHVPHLLAAALAGALPEPLFELTASGFRDSTRIAASDPALWTGIFLQNQQEILAALGPVRDQLERFRQALAAADAAAVRSLLEQAKRVRDALGS